MNEPKPCSGVLFKNDRKTKETHADYNGTLILEDGTECWLNAWVKHGKTKTFMSLSFKPKEPRQQAQKPKAAQEPERETPAKDGDDIPF
jgi:hypothetical protein